MAGIFKITVVCAFFLGLFCQTAAFAYSYDEIVQMVQAEEKAFGKADYSKSLDQRIQALEVQVLGSVQTGSDSLRLRRVCKKLGLQTQEGPALAAPYSVLVAPSTESSTTRTAEAATAKDIALAPSSNASYGDSSASTADKKSAKSSQGTLAAASHAPSAKSHAKAAAGSKQSVASVSTPSSVAAQAKTKLVSTSGTEARSVSTATSATQTQGQQPNPTDLAAQQPASQENRTTLYCVMAAALLGILGICVGMLVYLRNDKEEAAIAFTANRSLRRDSSMEADEAALEGEVSPQASRSGRVYEIQESASTRPLEYSSIENEAEANQQLKPCDSAVYLSAISFAVPLENASLQFVPQNENLIAAPTGVNIAAAKENKVAEMLDVPAAIVVEPLLAKGNTSAYIEPEPEAFANYAGEPLVSFLCDPFFETSDHSICAANIEEASVAFEETGGTPALPGMPESADSLESHVVESPVVESHVVESHVAPEIGDLFETSATLEDQHSAELSCEPVAEVQPVEPVMPPAILQPSSESYLFSGESHHVSDYAVEWQNALSRNPFINDHTPSGKFLPLPGEAVAEKGTKESFDLIAAEMAQAELAIAKSKMFSNASAEPAMPQTELTTSAKNESAASAEFSPVQRSGSIHMEFSSLLDAMTGCQIDELIDDFSSTSNDSNRIENFNPENAENADCAADDDGRSNSESTEGALEANLAEQLMALLSFGQDYSAEDGNCEIESERASDPSSLEDYLPAAWPSFEAPVSPKISSVVNWNRRNVRKVLMARSQESTGEDSSALAFFGAGANEWNGDSFHALAQLLIDAARQATATTNGAGNKCRIPLSVPMYGRSLSSKTRVSAYCADTSDFQNRLRGLFSEAV